MRFGKSWKYSKNFVECFASNSTVYLLESSQRKRSRGSIQVKPQILSNFSFPRSTFQHRNFPCHRASNCRHSWNLLLQCLLHFRRLRYQDLASTVSLFHTPAESIARCNAAHAPQPTWRWQVPTWRKAVRRPAESSSSGLNNHPVFFCCCRSTSKGKRCCRRSSLISGSWRLTGGRVREEVGKCNNPTPPSPFTMLPRCSETPETVVMMMWGGSWSNSLHNYTATGRYLLVDLAGCICKDTWKVLAMRAGGGYFVTKGKDKVLVAHQYSRAWWKWGRYRVGTHTKKTWGAYRGRLLEFEHCLVEVWNSCAISENSCWTIPL